MDPKKVGSLIKKIRQDNNLTQKDLADKYGVTYQAVSKWENGTNLPDISLIKEICNDYNIDVNDFLDGNNKKKEVKHKNTFLLFIIPLIIILSVIFVLYIVNNYNPSKPGFNFKTISTTCDAFKVTGSIAYDKNNSSIFINNINYCGGDDVNKYESITCTLKENDKTIYTCDEKNNLKLEDYLSELKIKVDHFEQSCKIYKEDTLVLTIEAKDGSKKITYDIPLHFDDEC